MEIQSIYFNKQPPQIFIESHFPNETFHLPKLYFNEWLLCFHELKMQKSSPEKKHKSVTCSDL